MTGQDSATPSGGDARSPFFYATKPTRGTLFWRTFLPWQFYRFLCINWKMIGMIRRSHAGGRR